MEKKSTTQTLIASLSDVEVIEETPLEERQLAESTYELLCHSAQQYAEKIALTYIENTEAWSPTSNTERSLSYRDLWQSINQTANGLRSLGLTDTDVISVALPNIPECHIALWAGEAAAIVNPINYFLEAEVIAEILMAANSKVLFIHGEHAQLDSIEKLQTVIDNVPCLTHVIVVGQQPKVESKKVRLLSFTQLGEGQVATALSFSRHIDAADTASLFHTGGTTGVPKLARHSHLNEVYTAWILGEMFGAMENNCYLVGLPLFHCNAAIGSGLTVFAGGGHVVLAGINGYRSPGMLNKLYPLVEHFQVTNLSAVPTVYSALTQMDSQSFDLSSLEYGLCGAAPLPGELLNAFQSKTGIRIVEGYGLTEATVCSTLSPPAGESRVGSVGLRLPYTELTIAKLDTSGNFSGEAANNEVGELLLRGPSVTPGYTEDSKNKELWVNDAQGKRWLRTGDLGRVDEEGYVWLTGRSKELIIRGGHNIDPQIIENALLSHPAVSLAAAVGRPDAYAGELPVAYVTVSDNIDAAMLQEHCQGHIGERAAIPKQVIIIENMPVTGVGKIYKPELIEREVLKVVQQSIDALNQPNLDIKVSVENHKTFGMFATLTTTRLEQQTHLQLDAHLAQYSFKSSIEVTD